MRELESSLQQFGEFLLKAQLVRPTAAPYFVRWVRRFLSRPASDEPLADQVRGFCEELERNGGSEDWQVRQADQALRIYFVNFLKRTEWHRRPASTVVDEQGRTSPLAALEQLRTRLRTRHYSYRTECTYADWVRRFLDYAAQQQGVPHPRVESEVVRDYPADPGIPRARERRDDDDLHTRGQGVPKPRAKPSRHPPQAHGAVMTEICPNSGRVGFQEPSGRSGRLKSLW